jgi:hypothetical protein
MKEFRALVQKLKKIAAAQGYTKQQIASRLRVVRPTTEERENKNPWFYVLSQFVK